MAICAGALREYLESSRPADRPLLAMVRSRSVPATRRICGPTGCRGSSPTSRPTVADPLDRVRRVTRDDEREKGNSTSSRPRCSSIEPVSRPALATRLPPRGPPADGRSMAPPINVYLQRARILASRSTWAGARLDHYFPVSTIGEGMGLNITVQSYLDRLVFGLVACREHVPDLWDMSISTSRRSTCCSPRTGATRAQPRLPAPPRRGRPGAAVSPTTRRTRAAKQATADRPATIKPAPKKAAGKPPAAKAPAAQQEAGRAQAAGGQEAGGEAGRRPARRRARRGERPRNDRSPGRRDVSPSSRYRRVDPRRA